MNESEQAKSIEGTKETKALLKKRRREEKKRQQEAAARKARQKRTLKRAVMWSIPVVLVVVGAWAITRTPRTSDGDDPLISRSGIHWHQNLSITIKGESVTIPANIGLGAVHSDTHTHKENDQIHLEMSRPVRESDTRLGVFFDVWGKEFSSQCILDSCNGDDGVVKMLVNGEESFEFENYRMKDGDTIEIRYE